MASKPDPKASKPDPGQPVPAASPVAPPPPPAPAAGYWLAAELLGPADAQAAARNQLAADLGAAPDAAGMLGTVPALPDAIRWLARWVFAGDPLPPLVTAPADSPLHEGPVPRPGGALLTAHDVVAHAFTIKVRSADGGTREIRWPQTAAEIAPPDRL